MTGVSHTLVVSWTDTGVGKTIVTAALAALAVARGLSVTVVKPVQTGLAPDEAGDLAEIRRLAGVEDLHELARFADPLAPATAARRAGVAPLAVAELADAIAGLVGRELVLVEGAGGLLVRLDRDGSTIADLAQRLRAPVLIVTRAGLGTLSGSALACEGLARRGIPCLGTVIGAWPAHPDLAALCNLEDLPSYTGRPLLGLLPDGAGGLEPSAFLVAARSGVANVLDTLYAMSPDRSTP